RHAERELMRRSHVDYFWRALLRWSRDCNPVPVNRSWNDGCSGKAKGSASLVKSGILDPRDFTSIYQRHRANHHCLLRSSCDDDLVGMTACSSVITQISCECFA